MTVAASPSIPSARDGAAGSGQAQASAPTVAFKAQFEAALAEARAERFSHFDNRALCWLAMPPAWTLDLAERCEFPVSGMPLPEFLRAAESARLCETEARLTRDGTAATYFWMPSAARAETFAHLRRASYKPEDLTGIALQEIAPRLLGSLPDPPEPDDALTRYWAELGVALRDGTGDPLGYAVTYMSRSVRTLIESKRAPEALERVRAAEFLAVALRGKLDLAIELCRRQVELAYRREQDKRHLDNFLRRKLQLEAFEELMNADPSHPTWALHYLGMGGVGKTMLLRYVTTELDRRKIPVARVDFDHLSPDYPARRPAQLLIELAEELRLYVDTEQRYALLEEFENRVIELHEAISAETPAGEPLANLHREEFARVLRAFKSFLLSLPQPVVLILDTCEELAKFRLIGERLPNVEATFEILERIHGEPPEPVPTARVIFAGRRLLAQAGAGWHIDPGAISEAHAFLPERKEYLRLHEIRGFLGEREPGEDRSEVEQYVAGIKGLALADDLRAAILERSPDVGTAAPIVWEPPLSPDLRPRYNPFDMALYADWVHNVPTLKAEAIRSGETDPYIEMRIVNRLRDDRLKALLPGAILLRRFDQTMLRPLLPGADDALYQQFYRELSDQEWIDARHDASVDTVFLEVDRNLQERLARFFAADTQRQQMKTASDRLGPPLDAFVRDRNERTLRQLSTSHIDAALRILPPARAADLWDDITLRIPGEADLEWVRNVTERLLGPDGAAGDEHSPLRAAVLATAISVPLHTEGDADLRRRWRAVAEGVNAMPLSGARQWIADRALLGQVAASYNAKHFWEIFDAERHLPDDILRQFASIVALVAARRENFDLPERAEQTHAAIAAACQRVLDIVEDEADPARPPADDPGVTGGADAVAAWAESAGDVLSPWAESGVMPLRAFVMALQARLLALRFNFDDARATFEGAERVAEAALVPEAPVPGAQRWLDWQPPAALRERIRLEMMRRLPPATFAGDDAPLDAWLRDTLPLLKTIDGERLASAVVQFRLARKPMPRETVEELVRGESYDAQRRAVCTAHRAAPPLAVSLAWARVALGDIEGGYALADRRTTEATGSGKDPLTLAAARGARAAIVRRMRQLERLRSMAGTGTAPDPDDWEGAALTLPGGSRLPDIPDAAWDGWILHRWWRALSAPSDAQIMQIRRSLHTPSRAQPAKDNMLSLDFVESMLLEGQTPRDAPSRLSREEELRELGAWSEAHPLDAADGFRLNVRAAALFEKEPGLSSWEAAVGLRRMGEIALDEGEMMALRLPRLAAPLLDWAAAWLARADDAAGSLMATAARALALIRAAQNDEAKYVVRNELRPVYDAVWTDPGNTGLPHWDLLQMAGDAASQKPVSPWVHPWWGGWLERITSCIVWEMDASGESATSRTWQSILRGKYGEQLPLELNLPSLRTLPESSSGCLSALSLRNATWLLALIGFAIIGGLLYGGYWVTGWVGSWFGVRWTWWGQLLIFVLALGSLGFASPLLNRLAGWIVAQVVARGVEAIVAIHAAPGKTLPADAQLRFSLHFGRERWQFGFGVFGEALAQLLLRVAGWLMRRRAPNLPVNPDSPTYARDFAVASPGFRSAREAAADVPREVIANLESVASLIGGRAYAVGLSLGDEPSLASAWEAALTLALPAKDGSPLNKVMRFWRATGKLADRNSWNARWLGGLIDVNADPAELDAARKVWSPLGESRLAEPTSAIDAYASSGDLAKSVSAAVDETLASAGRKTPAEYALVHLVGNAVRSTGGIVLQLGESTEDDDPRQQYNVRVKASKVPARRRRSAGLIRPDQLPPGVPLVVVQGATGEVGERYTTDRERAGDLRIFAAQCAENAAAVLVLPSMPPALSEALLRRLATTLAARRDLPRAWDWAALAAELRDLALVWDDAYFEKEIPAETRLELALEICLYAQTDESVPDVAAQVAK